MKSRLSSLALHPMRWLVASLVAAGVILIALGASLIAPVVGGALVALSVGGMAYLVTRSLQAAHRDLQQQLAERTDALNQTLVQLQTEANRNRNLLEAIGAIIHSIADSVIVVDRAGAILIANPAAQRLIAPRRAIGAPLAVWLRDASVAEEREHVTRSIQLQVQRSGLKVQWAGQRTLSLSLAPVQLHPERQALGHGDRVSRRDARSGTRSAKEPLHLDGVARTAHAADRHPQPDRSADAESERSVERSTARRHTAHHRQRPASLALDHRLTGSRADRGRSNAGAATRGVFA